MEISEQDYEENVNKILKDYQHKANIPGFRPGKVPTGLIRKMYGKAVLADEINKLMGDSMAKYIHDENLEVLGNPLPNREKNTEVNFDLQKNFEFFFDLGLAPKVELSLSDAIKAERFQIKVDDEMVHRYLEETTRRNGTSIHPDTSSDEDMMTGELVEVDEAGLPIENGVKKDTFLSLNQLSLEGSRKQLTGLKKEDSVRIDPTTFFASQEEASKALGLPKEKLKPEGQLFDYFIRDIHRIEPAPLDPVLFNKVYPDKNIETEELFIEEVRTSIAKNLEAETDKLFFNQVTLMLVKEANLQLPDDFLKRWLLENRKANITPADISNEYPSFADSTRWQLIENKILQENQVKVSEDEVKSYIKNYFTSQLNLTEVNPEMEQKYDALVDTVMKDEKQVDKIYEDLYHQKLMELFRNNLDISTTEVSYEEFINLASANHMHDHDHEHEREQEQEQEENQ